MLTAAALCPAPPLLIPELTGAAEVAADLRAACLASVTELADGKPDVIAIVGGAGQTRRWQAGLRIDLGAFAPGRAGVSGDHGAGGRLDARCESGAGGRLDARRESGAGGRLDARRDAGAGDRLGAGSAGFPATLGVGGWLLDQAGHQGERVLQSVGADEPADACAGLGVQLAGLQQRVGLLVMADGSTRRGLKAPGYLDERSEAFDAAVEQAVRDGDLRGLLDVDQELASELMATGRAAWQVLAGGAAGHQVSTEIRYSGDPFGVAYLVASVRVRE